MYMASNGNERIWDLAKVLNVHEDESYDVLFNSGETVNGIHQIWVCKVKNFYLHICKLDDMFKSFKMRQERTLPTREMRKTTKTMTETSVALAQFDATCMAVFDKPESPPQKQSDYEESSEEDEWVSTKTVNLNPTAGRYETRSKTRMK